MFDWGPWRDYLAAQGYPPSKEAIAEAENYLRHLYERNRVMNLTRVPESEAVAKHFLDAVLPVALIPMAAKLLDIGTGPGIPAVPLALARSDLSVTAMDSGAKGLRLVLDHGPANVVVKQGRAEEVDQRESFDVVVGRAVAPFAIQLEISAAWVRRDGLLIPYRTPTERAEIEDFPAHELGLELEDVRELNLPGTDVIRLFPVFVKARSTPAHYPRTWSQIRNAPLGHRG